MKPIRLLFAENVVSRGGSRLHQRVTFCVEVENLGFEKRVEVHWAGEDGSWRVIAAHRG